MKFSDFLFLLRSDLYRYGGKKDWPTLLKNWLITPGVKYSFYLRACQYLRAQPLRALGCYYLFRFLLLRVGIRYGIDIPSSARIGSGLYIGHYGGIVVNKDVVIGRNCNISHGVTLGQVNRGEKIGCPTIGDNVFIGPGAKILGKISIGNDVAIGANCVVVDNVPDGGVAVGVPGRVISRDGSRGYINFIDY